MKEFSILKTGWNICRSKVEIRNIHYSDKLTLDDLWRSVRTVSNQGARKGRAKSVRRRIYLRLPNMGEGVNRFNIPGLNTPLLNDRKVLTPSKSSYNFDNEMTEARSKITYLSPMERGWSGRFMLGRSLGPPVSETCEFENFDSILLQLRRVVHMSGTLGRKPSFKALVAIGNGNGIGGFSTATASTPFTSMVQARDRAGKKLQYIQRFNEHTVYHNMFHHLHRCRIYIQPREKGFGLKCNRVLKAVCKLLGIKNIQVKDANGTCINTMLHAFFRALDGQESHQDLVNRTNKFLVAFKEEEGLYPNIIASPTNYTGENIKEYDFDTIYTQGKLRYIKPKLGNQNIDSMYLRFLRRKQRFRNQNDVHLLRQAGLHI
ncbi:28S ribosomal protein S5, mitochondrial [Intoshia linei]|uniref:Small ribosomal subunit protein uS5m n=1 Tax=Intoshia linei TaxID=1819745 RepID=A0A177ASI7_9BILA|nr:28S ribosomal protein S5, mitochondrial [Intoshia linei]